MDNAPQLARDFAAPPAVTRRVEELYTAHARLVRSVCRSMLRNRDEADDALQQTFLSAQRALMNGSSPREPAAWLATIARNECLARVRDRMREPLPIDAEPTNFGADAYAAAVSREEFSTLREALADLPRAQREAILLRELRGLSYDEVARALSMTTAAVESLIFRARRTLQVKLREAVPALSPIALFARLFGSGAGDAVAPAVKVAAVGVGAAILAGGATFGSRALGLGHGHAAVTAHHSAPPVHVQAASPAIWSLPVQTSSPPAHEVGEGRKVEHETNAAETASSDVAESSTPESSRPESSAPEREKGDTASVVPSTPPADSSSSGSSEPADPSEPPDPPEPSD